MRPVIETIAGREIEITLTLGQLDEIAQVNPQFEEMALAFRAGVWDWREVTGILSAALRPHRVKLETVIAEVGAPGAKAMAARIWLAAMGVEPTEGPAGNVEAVTGAETAVSSSAASSVTA